MYGVSNWLDVKQNTLLLRVLREAKAEISWGGLAFGGKFKGVEDNYTRANSNRLEFQRATWVSCSLSRSLMLHFLIEQVSSHEDFS